MTTTRLPSRRAGGGQPDVLRGREQSLVVGHERGEFSPDRQRGGQVNRVDGAQGLWRNGGRRVEHIRAEPYLFDSPDLAQAAGKRAGIGSPDRPGYLGSVNGTGHKREIRALSKPSGQGP